MALGSASGSRARGQGPRTSGRGRGTGAVVAVLRRLPAQGKPGDGDRDGGGQDGQADDLAPDEPHVKRQASGEVGYLDVVLLALGSRCRRGRNAWRGGDRRKRRSEVAVWVRDAGTGIGVAAGTA